MIRWLNAKVMQAIERRSGTAALARIEVTGEVIDFEYGQGFTRSIAIADIARVVAVRAASYGGDEMTLLIETAKPPVVEAGASSPGWTDMCEALDSKLTGAMPFGQWFAKLQAANIGDVVTVWEGGRNMASGEDAP